MALSNKEKQATIALLEAKIEKVTGKKVTYKEVEAKKETGTVNPNLPSATATDAIKRPGVQNEAPLEEKANPAVEGFVNEIFDILSSGQGFEFTDWHKNSLTELCGRIPDKLKDAVWKLYGKRIAESDGEGVYEGELAFMAALFKKPKPKIVFESKASKIKAIHEKLEKLTGKKVVFAEGIWGKIQMPKDAKVVSEAIKELENWKTKYYNTLGSDDIFDGIDAAIKEVKVLANLAMNQHVKG